MKEQSRKIFEEFLHSQLSGSEPADPLPFLERVPEEDRLAFKKKLAVFQTLDRTFKKISEDHAAIFAAVSETLQEDLREKTFAGCRLLKKLGQGGMGVVYLANQEKLKREVVLKILQPFASNNPTLVARFLRESEIIANLEHPNILPIYDVGEEEGSVFIITKYIQGKSLAQLINFIADRDRDKVTLRDLSFWLVEGVLPSEEPHRLPGHHPTEFFLKVMEKVGEAVQFAHSRGVAHRDIKPSNIIVQPDGTPVLLDFGLAWVEKDRDITVQGEFLGTPVYSAPESFRKVSTHNHFLLDVYSLGVTTYELITGKLPYAGETLYEVYNNLKNKEPTPPKVHWKEIPGDLETILMTAIAKDPARRYPSVEEFRQDLHRFLHDQPIHAKPPPWWQRAIYFLKRNYRWEIPAALGLLAILGIGLATRSTIRLSEVEAERTILQALTELLEAKREKAAEVFANGKKVLRQIEQSLLDLTTPRPQDQRALAQTLLAQNPQDYLAHHILADLYLLQGQDMERAKQVVRGFNRYYPEESKLNGLLGTRCLVLRHYACAQEFLTLATWQNHPKFGEFLIAAHVAMGNYEGARRLCEVGTEYFPDNPQYPQGLALMLAKLERFEEAKAAAKKSLALDPGNPQTQKLLRAVEAQIYFDQQKKLKGGGGEQGR